MAERNSFRIRAAVMKDAAGIAGLCGQLGYPSATADVERRLGNILYHRGGLELMLEIRDMTAGDEYYVGACTHVGESEEMDACAARRAAWLRQMHGSGLRVKVAALDGERVGFAYVMPVEISPWGPLGENLLVLPCLVAQERAKGKGAGRALLKAAEAEARKQDKKGLVTVVYDHHFWFMPASFFTRCGFAPARHREAAAFPGVKEMIMWKRFDSSAKVPLFLEPGYRYEPLPGKVVIDLFWNTFCQTSVLEAGRVREVAGEFEDSVVLREYCADDRGVLLRHQISRGIFVNGREIGWGYEAPREGIREAIAGCFRHRR